MTNSKFVWGGIVIAIVLGLFGLKYPELVFTGTSPAGTSFSNMKIAQEVAAAGTVDVASTTLVSMLNSDANDRIINEFHYFCSDLGTVSTSVSNMVWTASTSTAPYLASSANYVLNTVIATTSGAYQYFSSTSPGTIGILTPAATSTRLWQSGTYLNFVTNATTSASCIIGVQYYPS